MGITKPYEFTRFGAMAVTKPYEFIGFGAVPWRLTATMRLRGSRRLQHHGWRVLATARPKKADPRRHAKTDGLSTLF